MCFGIVSLFMFVSFGVMGFVIAKMLLSFSLVGFIVTALVGFGTAGFGIVVKTTASFSIIGLIEIIGFGVSKVVFSLFSVCSCS